MKRNNPYISTVFAFIAAFGITVSSIHIHELDTHDADTKHVLVVQDDLHCVICGSIFKTTSVHETHSQHLADSDIIHFFDATEKAQQPFEKFQEGRSPPIIS